MRTNHKLLKNFSSIAIAILASHLPSNAQIYINDPDDITVDNGHSYTIDLNNDGTSDFVLKLKSTKYRSSNSSACTLIVEKSTYFIQLPSGKNSPKPPHGLWLITSNNYVKALTQNNLITYNMKFSTNNNGIGKLHYYRYSYCNTSHSYNGKKIGGNFPKGQEKFIGVKFMDKNGEFHLGWIKIKATGKKSFIIEKWGYNSDIEKPIYAGTKPLDLQVADSGTNYAVISLKSKFTGIADYVLILANKPVPVWQQVIRGTDGEDQPPVYADSVKIEDTAPDSTQIELYRLEENTSYILCITLKDQNGNIDKTVYTVPFSTSSSTVTQTSKNQNTINIYPTPTKNILHIELNSDENFSAKIFNLQGQLILSVNSHEPHSAMDLSSIPPGLYILKIKTPSTQLTKKIIKY